MKVWFLAKGYGKGAASAQLFNLLVLFILLCSFNIGVAKAQTSALQFSPIPISDPDIVSPGRGAEQWHNASAAIANPADDNNLSPLDVYYRFTWNRLEGPGQDEYHWEFFDGLVKSAINKGQKLSFGIMSCYPQGHNSPGVVEFDNGNAAYPEYLHWLMQSEPYKDWKTTGFGPTDDYGSWIPNWNSPNYLARLRALHQALYAHINSSFYTAERGPLAGKSIAFKDAIFSIDIRGYGAWGEWHSGSIIDHIWNYPEGRAPDASTLKTIIDHHADVFTNHPLSLMISIFDGERLSNTYTPKEVGAYALERSNNWGRFGWRRDNWGATDEYLDLYLKDNLNFYGNTGPFNKQIMDRWKHAPITGEPPGWVATLYGYCYYDDLERQIREYHATSLGNGNYGMYYLPDCTIENLRSAFKATGYRFILEDGSITNDTRVGGELLINLNWKNIGIAPTYEKWDVVYELKDKNNSIVWSDQSAFSPGRKDTSTSLLPASEATQVTDRFTLPSDIATGDYQLNLIIKDPSGYRSPLPLAIQGRNDDGSYTLKNIFVDVAGTDVTAPAAPTPATGNCPVIEASLSQTSGCDGEQVSLVLSSATGDGPFNIVVNGEFYNNINVGAAFTTLGSESIWSTVPSTVTDIDRPVELGVKFVSSEAGFIKGIRFFSADIIAGTYTGHLWTVDGTLLGSAEFSNVTPSGWQEVLFPDPVAITPGTIYIASYYTSVGIYAGTTRGLSEPVSNGQSLTALGSDASDGNGVYTYDGPGFPYHTYNASNYWVDVLFTKSSPVFNLTGITDKNGCTSSGSLHTLVVNTEPCVQQRSSASSTSEIAKAPPMVSVKEEAHFNELIQNYPNPFRTGTVISYRLAKAGKINLSVYDMNGKLVKTIADGSREAGIHVATMKAGELAAGIYFYKLQAGNFSEVKKMIIQ